MEKLDLSNELDNALSIPDSSKLNLGDGLRTEKVKQTDMAEIEVQKLLETEHSGPIDGLDIPPTFAGHDSVSLQDKFERDDIEDLKEASVEKQYKEDVDVLSQDVKDALGIKDPVERNRELPKLLERPVERLSGKDILNVRFGKTLANKITSRIPIADFSDVELRNITPNQLVQIDKELLPAIGANASRGLFQVGVLRDLHGRYGKILEDQGTVGFVVDFSKSFIPFYDAIINMDAFVDVESVLPGNNLAEQIDSLVNGPLEDFEPKLRQSLDILVQDNPQKAVQLLQAISSYGTESRWFDNGMFLFDAGTLVSPVTILKLLKVRKAKVFDDIAPEALEEQVIKSSVDQAKAELAHPLDKGKQAKLLGKDHESAAHIVAKAERGQEDIQDQLSSIFDLDQWRTQSRNSDSTLVTQVLGDAKTRAKRIESIISGARLGRLSDAEVSGAVQDQIDTISQVNKTLSDAILDVDVELVPETNTHNVILTLGTPKTKEGFKSLKAANNSAKRDYGLDPKDFDVIQQGNTFKIQARQGLKEDSLKSLEAINTDPESLLSGTIGTRGLFAGLLRNTNVLSTSRDNANRLSTQGFTSRLNEELSRVVNETVGQLKAKPRKRFNKFIEKQNRDVNGGKGHFFRTVDEVSDAWRVQFGQPIRQEELNAYLGFQQLSDLDWVLRNNAILRDKTIQGFRNYKIVGTDLEFEGRRLTDTSGISSVDTIAVIDNRALSKGSAEAKNHAQLSEFGKVGKSVRDDIKSGKATLLKVFEERSVGSALGAVDAKYVVTYRNVDRNLDYQQLGRAAGSHLIYKDENYIKQAKVIFDKVRGKKVYAGDTTILAVNNALRGSDAVKAFNRALELRKTDVQAYQKYVSENLPFTHRTIENWIKKGLVDPDQLLQLVARNRKTIDSRPDLNDVVRIGDDDAAGVESKFTQSRDSRLPTIYETEGAETKPLFEIGEGEVLDPTEALVGQLNNIATSSLRDDYLQTASRQLFNNFKEVLRDSKGRPLSEKEFLRNPLKVFRNPNFDETTDNLGQLQAAKNLHSRLRAFVGIPSKEAEAIIRMKRNLLDNLIGSKESSKVSNFIETVLDPTASPTRVLRATGFHSKLGLLNVQQFALQAQTAAVAVAVDPKNGVPAVGDAIKARLLMRSVDSDDVVEQMAKSTKSPEFKEMFSLLKDSGYDIVRGEVAQLDDVVTNRLLPSNAGKLLDAGTVFFREGEAVVRATGFFTAARQVKALKKGGVLTKKDIPEILRRADDLNLNMTRASNASWQEGLLSVPTQFYSFHARLTESLLMPGGFTLAQRARVVTLFSAMYGVPIGLGSPLSIFTDVNSHYKDLADEHGFDTKSSPWMHVLSEGLPDYALALATGRDFNLETRFGPTGLSTISDILDGESLTAIAGGAPGSIAADIGKSILDLVFPLGGWAIERPEGERLEAVRNAVSNISTLDTAADALEYLTSNIQLDGQLREVATDVGGMEAAMRVLFGLRDSETADLFRKNNLNHRLGQKRRASIRALEKEYRRALVSIREGDSQGQYKPLIDAIIAQGKLSPSEAARVFSRVHNEDKSRTEAVNERIRKYQERNER